MARREGILGENCEIRKEIRISIDGSFVRFFTWGHAAPGDLDQLIRGGKQ